MGRRLRNKIIELEDEFQDLVSKLANLAFSGSKPTYPDIDWSAPSYSVSIDTTNIGNATVEETFPQSVIEGGDATITVKPATGYELTAVSYKIGASGESQTAVIGSNGKAVITIQNVTADITVFLTTTTQVEYHTVSADLKKITSFGTQYGSTGNTDGDVSGVTLNTSAVSDQTPECALSNDQVAYGYEFTTVVQPASGYAIYSIKVMMNNTNITGDVFDPDTNEITVANPNSTLSIEVVVAAVTNGMFAGSFFSVPNGDTTDKTKVGFIVNDNEWCCMSKFIKVPATDNTILWTIGNSSNTPYSPSGPDVSGAPCYQQRCLIYYDKDFQPITYITFWDKTKYERTGGLTTTRPAYVRASFKTSLLTYAALSLSPDTSNWTWTKVWPSNS